MEEIGVECIYLLSGVSWHHGDSEVLFVALNTIKNNEEVVFPYLSHAYHMDGRLGRAVREGRPPPAIAAIVFLDLAMPSGELPGQIQQARTYLPSALFVLYGDLDECRACMDGLPQDWVQRLAVYYRLARSPQSTLNIRLRSLLNEARAHAFVKRDTAKDHLGLIFLSYSRGDKELADKLALWMKTDGCEVWHDDSELFGGQDWMDAVGAALRRSEILVLVLSEEALKSRFVKFEYRHFVNTGKPIVPVLAKEVHHLPPELETIQWVDFSFGDPALRYPILSRAVRKLRLSVDS